MEEKSWRRNHGGKIMEDKSWGRIRRRNHEVGIMKTRNGGGKIMGGIRRRNREGEIKNEK